MPAYNLTTKEGREEMRQDRLAELQAVESGTWPRDINDIMRWNPPAHWEPSRWAARMCRADLGYLAKKDSEQHEGRCAVGD